MNPRLSIILLTVLATTTTTILPGAAITASTASMVTGSTPDENTAPSTTSTDESWRKTPPPTLPPQPVNLPNAQVYKLNNGLTVELLPDHRVPFITVDLGIKVGSSQEDIRKSGVSGLTAQMLTEGTKTKTSKEIAQESDFIGGALKGGSDYDFTVIGASALSKYTNRLMSLLSDVLLNPTFPDKELRLAKDNLLQELVMKRSEPGFLVDERFNKVVFGNHPYSVTAPTPAAVKSITRTDLQTFHSKYYAPNSSILVVVGDFDAEKMKALIQQDFGSKWKMVPITISHNIAVPKLHGRRIYLVNRPGSVQSSIKLGNVAIAKTNPDYFSLLVANQILGGAAHSRLFLNIREQKGYTYGAYSGFAARKNPGDFAAHAEVRTDVTSPSLQEFFYELDRLRNVKVSNQELKDAKNYLTGSFQLGLETQAGLAQRLLETKLYDLPTNYLTTYVGKIMAVTPDDVRRVARKYIDSNDLTIVVVGDAKKILPDLKYYAPVEIYDTTGRAISTARNTID